MLTLALLGLVGGLITGVSPCVLPMLPIIFFASGSTVATPTPAVRKDDREVAEAAPAEGPAPSSPPRQGLRRRSSRPPAVPDHRRPGDQLQPLHPAGLDVALRPRPARRLPALGRLIVLGLVGLGLIFPPLGHWIEKPFYRLPKVSNSDAGPFVLGLGLGTLYVPCAGPILAAITVAGATGDVGLRTVVLTVSFAIGAALPLLLFAMAGSNIRKRIDSYRARATGFRIGGGIVMLVLAVALAFNLTDVVQRALPNYTSGIEKKLAENDTVQGALTPFETAENKGLSKCTPAPPSSTRAGRRRRCGARSAGSTPTVTLRSAWTS